MRCRPTVRWYQRWTLHRSVTTPSRPYRPSVRRAIYTSARRRFMRFPRYDILSLSGFQACMKNKTLRLFHQSELLPPAIVHIATIEPAPRHSTTWCMVPPSSTVWCMVPRPSTVWYMVPRHARSLVSRSIRSPFSVRLSHDRKNLLDFHYNNKTIIRSGSGRRLWTVDKRLHGRRTDGFGLQTDVSTVGGPTALDCWPTSPCTVLGPSTLNDGLSLIGLWADCWFWKSLF